MIMNYTNIKKPKKIIFKMEILKPIKNLIF